MSIAWRIVKRKHASSAFTGEGARIFGGRWNYPGTAIVYLAQSQSLAALEMLVHLDGSDLLRSYVTIKVEFDDALVETLDPQEFVPNWRNETAIEAIRRLGHAWCSSGRSPLLRVPSVVVPSESNYLLNPRHPQFGQIVIHRPVPFEFDRRLARQY